MRYQPLPPPVVEMTISEDRKTITFFLDPHMPKKAENPMEICRILMSRMAEAALKAGSRRVQRRQFGKTKLSTPEEIRK